MLRFKARKETVRVIVHGGCVPSSVPLAYLRANGRANGLLEIGYHYVIDEEGGLHEGRPTGVMGSHTPGHNHNSLGVYVACCSGALSAAQSKALVDLSCVWGVPLVAHSSLIRYKNKEHTCPNFQLPPL